LYEDRKMKIKLLVLFVQYGEDKYKGSFKKLLGYLEQIRYCETTYYILDNKQENASLDQIEKNVYYCGGDNNLREFSGWQKGLEMIHQLGIQYHLILFCNSSFLVNGRSYLENYARISLLSRSLLLNRVIGRIDSHREPISVLGYDVSRWICTNCFFMPKKVIQTINNIITIDKNALGQFVYKSYNPAVFKPGAPLSNRYKELIIQWLTEKWHSHYDITPETWELTKAKIMSILNEALLSARIKEAGFKIKRYGLKKYY